MTVRISSFTSLTPNKPILYVLLIENVLGKLPVVPVGAGTMPHCLQNAFQGDSRPEDGSDGKGCLMWYVNSWATGWS